ncbi:VOC family protein [Streptococcus sp. DD12]|uniref:VOC family protein n=1 Tax=Streptococcus sp. DD12 TaxID=1777880 RepID=UPI00079A1B4A|nr:VOC family protein [Streptococcus sp. DD12]KXT75242.1 Glyoxalase family protein [Streptococcus sp. DD12]
MYPYNSQVYLGEVALNVRDLAQEKAFYEIVLGMDVIDEREGYVRLGVAGQPLVALYETSATGSSQASFGLYHMAIVLPSRQTLGDVFKRLADLEVPFVGGADHGYSEALYLEDPEGNGIELYRDKPVQEWDIREDGRIIGVTEELDAQAIYDMGEKHEPFHLAPGSRMGHVHLSTRHASQSSAFYQELLAMSEKFAMPSASWIASGDYHHHLAVNEWAAPQQSTREIKEPGLAYYVLELATKSDLLAIARRAENLGAQVTWLTSTLLSVTDADGIQTRLRLAKK